MADEGNSIHDTLASLSKLLQDREAELKSREEKLRVEQEAFERERHAVYGDTQPSDVLHLNIGGTNTTVLRRTLTSVPGSMLASRFSGRWDDSIEKDKDGNFFIDQPFLLFEPMLNYLRRKSNAAGSLNPVQSPTGTYLGNSGLFQLSDFYQMVEYYGMTDGIYPTKLTVRFGPEEAVEEISSWKVRTNEWVTIQLIPQGHWRKVKTYEVKLGSVQRVQIGWEFDSGYSHQKVDFSVGNGVGVGDVANTLAIDLTRSCYLANSGITEISDLEHKEGTVVRTEDYGNKIYVDGKLVASALDPREEGVVQSYDVKNWRESSTGSMIPIISIKGEFEISAVEFGD